MSKKVTMQDIADALGVSRSLVSRALADAYNVSEKTKALVRDEAERLGYIIKPAKKVHTFGNNNILVYIPRGSMYDQGFAMKILAGIEETAAKHGLRTSICVTENFYPPSPDNAMGVLILTTMSARNIRAVQTTGLPIVLVDFNYFGQPDDLSVLNFDNVTSESYNSILRMMNLLRAANHSHVAFVGYFLFARSFTKRYLDFLSTAKIFGIETAEVTWRRPESRPTESITKTIDKNRTFDIGEFLFNPEDLLDMLRSDFHPTALFCMNDVTAMQAYQVLKANGYAIPDDISIVGFDNISFSEWLEPPLTTIDIPKSAIGQEAVKLLISRWESPKKQPYVNVEVGTEIVERQSVKTL